MNNDNNLIFIVKDILSKHEVGDIVYKTVDNIGKHEYLVEANGLDIVPVPGRADPYKRLRDYLGTSSLPNLNGRYLRADTTPGQKVEAGLPNITGSVQNDVYGYGTTNVRETQGVFYGGRVYEHTRHASFVDGDKYNDTGTMYFDASKSNPIYGNSTTVTPPTYTVKAYICYA